MKKTVAVLVVFLVFCFSLAGCAGKNYVYPTKLDNADVVQFGRTGVFGTDHSGTAIIPKAPATTEPVKVKLEKYYHKTVESWTAKCPEHLQNPKQRKNWKYEETTENSSEEVLDPRAVPQSTIVIGGSNPSTGNLTAPAAAIAGGIIGGASVLRPDKTTIGTGSGGCGLHGCR